MYIYSVECKENGFYYECKSLTKICEMFDMKYSVVYNSVRNSMYNHRGYFTPKKKPKIIIKRHERLNRKRKTDSKQNSKR